MGTVTKWTCRARCSWYAGGVGLERMALAVGDDIHRRQSFGACQQALIKASKYITPQLQARRRTARSVGNTVNSGLKHIFKQTEMPLLKAQVIKINTETEALLEQTCGSQT